jgi:hypothetical protein
LKGLHKVNEKWHAANRMPENPSREQRVRWHAAHAAACGCREVPASLLAEVEALGRKASERTN